MSSACQIAWLCFPGHKHPLNNSVITPLTTDDIITHSGLEGIMTVVLGYFCHRNPCNHKSHRKTPCSLELALGASIPQCSVPRAPWTDWSWNYLIVSSMGSSQLHGSDILWRQISHHFPYSGSGAEQQKSRFVLCHSHSPKGINRSRMLPSCGDWWFSEERSLERSILM